MLAKVISYGKDREEARKRLVSALNRFHVEGVISNIDFANAILNHPAFIAGDLNTHFIEDHFAQGVMKIEPPMAQLEKMVIAATLVYHNRKNLVKDSLKPLVSRVGPNHKKKVWVHYVVKGLKNIFYIKMKGNSGTNEWSVVVNSSEYEVVTPSFEFYRRRLKLTINEQIEYFRLQYKENFIWASFAGITRTFEVYSPHEWELAGFMPPAKTIGKENILTSPMPGLVVDVKAKPGDRVYKGQDVVVIESMKMESGVASPCDGEVDEVKVNSGQAVETGDVMITFKI
jgi:propionyl-CoA carboxylase alpha chain